jgi:predicted ATPase
MPGLPPGILADRYEVGPIIGQGAMGIVYRATDNTTGQIVALKALRPEIGSANEAVLARFIREGEALRLLNHPNIVKMLDTVEYENRHYLIMEYVRGGSLQDLVGKHDQVPLDRVLRIALDLCDALTRAHRLNIIHRDLKPANVLLAEDGTPRLTDFGIAQMGDGSDITEEGSVIGTYSYLSPEACTGEALDTRADIWSFGVLFYEMLSGKRPFEGNSPGGIVTAILNAPVPDITQVRPDVPDTVQDLIYRMLVRSREERIQSIRMVGAEIEELLKAAETPAPMGKSIEAAPARPLTSFVPTPASAARRHNWPAQTTPFVGRVDQMHELDAMLDNSGCRLITLIGPGGMGKTRLALEVAARRHHGGSDAIAFVPLAPLTSPEFILSAIASAIGFAIDGQADPRQALLNHLGPQNLIMVLDNFEHVIEGANIVGALLEAAPAITMLATSRVRLNVRAECVYEVPGMAVPTGMDLEQLEDNEAAKMFLIYAQRAKAGYTMADKEREAVARICQLLDGMPLGLELAAAWIRSLPPREIAEELATDLDFLETALRDIPERQRGMRAVFEYSWRLLPEDAQEALRRLSVFRGGFTRDAAKEVGGARVTTLALLVDQSLLRRDSEGRYQQHELIRQYAAEKLSQDALAERLALSAHSAYFAVFLDQRRGNLRGEKQQETLAALDAEIDNLRAAWRQTVDQGDAAGINRYLEDLPLFYEIRGRVQESIEVFGWALEMLNSKYNERIQPGGDLGLAYGRLLRIRGQFAYRMGQHERAMSTLQQGIDLLRELNESSPEGSLIRVEKALCLNNMGNIASAVKDYTKARTLLEECLALYCADSNERGEATVLNNLGAVLKEMGEYDTALEAYSRALAIFEKSGNQYAIAVLYDNLGIVSEAMGQHGEAREYFNNALPRAWSLGGLPLVLDVLTGLATLDVDSDAARAARWSAMIRAHPAAYQDTKQKAQTLLIVLEAELSIEAMAQACSEGEALVLDEVMRGLLPEQSAG